MGEYLLTIIILSIVVAGFFGMRQFNRQLKKGRVPTSTLKGTKIENELIKLINAERIKEGLKPVQKDDAASKYAYSRLKDVIKDGKINHNNFKPDVLFTQGYQGVAENLAYGTKDAKKIFNMWMNSPKHKANMLNKNWTCIGLRGKQQGPKKFYVVSIFGR